MKGNPDVIVVGAGLAGLCCALQLQQSGLSVIVLEASDGAGGRVRTDRVEGFLLDRGFQVLPTGYPEAQRVLDYLALGLHFFYPGALVRFGGRFHRVADPWRHPLEGGLTFFSSIGSLKDKLLVGRVRARIMAGSVEDLFLRPETTTLEALQKIGFSRNMIDRFFRPFLGGIFFDPELEISSRMFEFVFRMFSLGETALPAGGMGAIPGQLASRLLPGTLRFSHRVDSVAQGGVTLASGERITSRAVVIATEGGEAGRLLGEEQPPGHRSATTLYFATEKSPLSEPLLVLNGDGKGPVNSLCVPSVIAPIYAPKGSFLLAASVIGNPREGDEQLEKAVRAQLSDWFGPSVDGWRHLRTYRISPALPLQVPPLPNPTQPTVQIHPWLFVCGEYRNAASIQWAMVSGRKAAETAIAARS
jgi:phytoene dehydrogenase-like protein